MPQNSQVLITGASSGIGAAYSRRLAQDGYTPILVARRLDRLEIVAKELEEVHGVSAECVALDLSLPAELEELTVPVLKEKLRGFGLTVSGRKADLIERLLEHAAASATRQDSDAAERATRKRERAACFP